MAPELGALFSLSLIVAGKTSEDRRKEIAIARAPAIEALVSPTDAAARFVDAGESSLMMQAIWQRRLGSVPLQLPSAT